MYSLSGTVENTFTSTVMLSAYNNNIATSALPDCKPHCLIDIGPLDLISLSYTEHVLSEACYYFAVATINQF